MAEHDLLSATFLWRFWKKVLMRVELERWVGASTRIDS